MDMNRGLALRPWVVEILCASVLLISNCGGWRDEARETLEINRQTWFSNMYFHYRFEFRNNCQTCENTYKPSIVEVWHGLQVAATYKDTGETVALENLYEFLPIEQLFLWALDAIDGNADVVDITYDPQLGYPKEIHIDWDTKSIDDELDYWASGVEKL